MARRKPRGRPVNGVLVLDKPAGMTSNDALQRARYLFYAAKAGHTGSLDPMATGVLPLCFGEATKFSQFLLDADKEYLSTFRLGEATATGDAEGEVIERADASGVSAAQLESAIDRFRGEILQVPSMYSALKKDGQPLYKLARQGIEVEREARPVTIHQYDLLHVRREGETVDVDVTIRCSKGTYVRTLAEDLGRELGCGAHVIHLHRRSVGAFTDDDAVSLAQLEALREGRRGEDLDYLLHSVDSAAAHLTMVALPGSTAWYFRRGQPVMVPGAYRDAREGDIVRIFDDGEGFLGVGEVLEDGRLAPRRLVVQSSAAS